jgi:hypothetical protein
VKKIQLLITPLVVFLGCTCGTYFAQLGESARHVEAQAALDPKEKPVEVVASGLSIVDSQGKKRFEACIRDGVPVFCLNDAGEKPLVMISAGNDGTSILMLNGKPDAQSQIELRIQQGNVAIFTGSAEHRASATMMVTDTGPSVWLAQFVGEGEEVKETNAVLNTNSLGGTLMLGGPRSPKSEIHSAQCLAAGVNPNGNCELRMKDNKDNILVALEAGKESTTFDLLRGPTGKGGRMHFELSDEKEQFVVSSIVRRAATEMRIDKDGSTIALTRQSGSATAPKQVDVNMNAYEDGGSLFIGTPADLKSILRSAHIAAGVRSNGEGGIEITDSKGKPTWKAP